MATELEGLPVINCREIQRVVWTDGPDAAPHDHLVECRTCREEARRAGDLRAALSGLRTRLAIPPDGLESAIVTAVTRSRMDWARDIVAHPKFWRGAAVGAAAAAAAATAAFGLIVARRRAAAPDLAA